MAKKNTDPVAQRVGLPRREFTTGLVAALGLVAAGCGSDVSSAVDVNPGLGSPTDSIRPLAVGLKERVGNVTERNLSPGADGVAVNAVAEGMNAFALGAYGQRSVIADGGNILLGNYSLATALLLALAGMEGELRSANAALLGVAEVNRAALDPAINALDLTIESRATDGLDILTANRLFVEPDLPLTSEYLDTATGNFGAPVVEVDFTDPQTAIDAVNSWISEQTDGFIDELVSTFDPDTVIAIVNAVYLKARWAVEFTDKGAMPFTLPDGERVEVPAFGHDQFLPLVIEEGFSAVELPYVGGNLSMVVLMPQDMTSFEASLSPETYGQIMNGLTEQGIHLTLPKWSFEQETDGLELLKPLGLQTNGDFGAMFEGGESGFSISQIDHKARIEVDETGTTAAASTNVAIEGSHGPTIDINKPFFYVIRDRGSGAILFSGRVSDPRQSGS